VAGENGGHHRDGDRRDARALAAWRETIDLQTLVLPVRSALALAAIDIIYSLRGVISKIHLIDAAAQLALVAVWAWGWTHRGG
jgi:hypothetical protein